MQKILSNLTKYYPFVFLYSLLTNGNNNLLLCSYILNFYGDNNWIIGTQYNIIIFLTFILLKLIFQKKELNNLYLNDYLLLKYMFNSTSYKTIKNQLFINVSILYNKFFFYVYKAKNVNYLLFLSNMSSLWRPLFKKYSYFGYYRIHRSSWSSLKSEEFNTTNQLK